MYLNLAQSPCRNARRQTINVILNAIFYCLPIPATSIFIYTLYYKEKALEKFPGLMKDFLLLSGEIKL